MEPLQRKLFINNASKKIGSLLPPGYKRVSHLESVDGAYIDLNLPHKDYPSFKGSFKTTELTPDAYVIFGVTGGDARAKCTLNSTGSVWGTHNMIAGYYAQYYAASFYVKKGKWHTFEIGMGYTTIDGETKTMAENYVATGRSYILFGYNNNGTITTYPLAKGDFQAFTGKDNPTIARDLICCVQESDGAGGYYDLANSVCPLTSTPFYCNAGNGYFVIGDEI